MPHRGTKDSGNIEGLKCHNSTSARHYGAFDSMPKPVALISHLPARIGKDLAMALHRESQNPHYFPAPQEQWLQTTGVLISSTVVKSLEHTAQEH